MLKKTITYEDWNGTERTEDFYFNLSRVEVIELEYSVEPGTSITETIMTLINSHDTGKIIKTIKDIILKSYGEKSADGKRFVKSDDIRQAFEENPAFDVLFMELTTNAEEAANFLSGIMPSSVRDNLGPDPSKALLEKMNNFQETGKVV